MGAFLGFLTAQRAGILILLLVLLAAGFLVNWALWMFGWGRYRGSVRADSKIRFVLAQFFVKIINEFRHLLALIIVLLFTSALFAAMWPGMMKQDVASIKDGIQGVAAALGGLFGSVIGYYFGESAANRRLDNSQLQPPAQPPVLGDVSSDTPGIEQTPKPPGLP